jgi:acetyl-CoA synthetase
MYTHTGKIMRRILRKVAAGDEEFGDTSTLADPKVVTSLVDAYKISKPAS